MQYYASLEQPTHFLINFIFLINVIIWYIIDFELRLLLT